MVFCRFTHIQKRTHPKYRIGSFAGLSSRQLNYREFPSGFLKKDHVEVFGIRVLPFGVWSPISKEEMQTASLTTPNGIELDPEEGVIYTEIQRERF